MKTDSDLKSDIHVALLKSFSINAENIGVHVLAGVVTLTGRVRSDADRWHLDDAVRSMPGVLGLTNETMVAPEALLTNPQSDTARPWFTGG